jgi:hypothetical protein
LELSAQRDSTQKLTFSGYAELYYSFDFSNPANHEKSGFIYNHKRHNEINANLILLKANYTDKSVRGNLGLMLGNYAQYNLSSEPTFAQFIYEANVGLKLSKTRNLWLDVGVMPSHIGFESAMSADCWTLTRSILAENSPYYETGLKLAYTSNNEKLNLNFLVLNGWQKIQKPAYIQKPSFGVQVNYKPNKNWQLNYSNFLGTDKPDSLNAFRNFHNFYVIYEPASKLSFIAGLDVGRDKYDAENYNYWFSPVFIMRYLINEDIKWAFRTEYYQDSKQIMIQTSTINGLQVFGLSSNVDFHISDKAQVRIEAKKYLSADPIFGNEKNNFSLTTNLTFKI